MKTMRTLTGLSALLLALTACSGGEKTEMPAPEPAAETEEPAPEEPEIDEEDLADADGADSVPSPVEMSLALEKGGVDTKLATLIPERELDLEKSDGDHAAVRTGVVLADLLLTVKTAEKDELLTRIDALRTGMNHLNGGSDINAVLTDFEERIKADSVSREDLLTEFEELSMVVIPELKFNGNERIVPLIKAGSWLEGAHLVAKAVKEADALKEGETTVADDLLKKPDVVGYFIKYVKTEGAEKAPEQITQKLEESLTVLKTLSEKEEPLVAADVDSVIKVTQDVLALL